MNSLKRNFIWLMASLVGIVVAMVILSLSLASSANAASPENSLSMPVSINALMVTMIDHSAHYIWDYAALEESANDEEWQAVEYYAVQLAAAGPMLLLGGSGQYDNDWVQSPLWLDYSEAMMQAGLTALTAARIQDRVLLMEAGDNLVESCEGCHNSFKPDTPSEGIDHDPQYDHLYHLFER